MPAVYQLAEGLNIRGLLDVLRKNPSLYRKNFVVGENEMKTDEFIDEVEPLYEREGTNFKSKEEALFQAVLDFFEAVGDKGLLFVFITVNHGHFLVPLFSLPKPQNPKTPKPQNPFLEYYS